MCSMYRNSEDLTISFFLILLDRSSLGSVEGLNYANDMPVKVTLKHPKGVCGYAVCDLLRVAWTWFIGTESMRMNWWETWRTDENSSTRRNMKTYAEESHNVVMRNTSAGQKTYNWREFETAETALFRLIRTVWTCLDRGGPTAVLFSLECSIADLVTSPFACSLCSFHWKIWIFWMHDISGCSLHMLAVGAWAFLLLQAINPIQSMCFNV